MMLVRVTKTVPSAARKALEKFELAVSDMAFIGSAHPQDHELIKAKYERARKLMLKHLAK